MQAGEARPRPSRGMEPGNRVSPHSRDFGSAPNLVFPRAGAVLPQPGFRCHLPGREKSGPAPARTRLPVVPSLGAGICALRATLRAVVPIQDSCRHSRRISCCRWADTFPCHIARLSHRSCRASGTGSAVSIGPLHHRSDLGQQRTERELRDYGPSAFVFELRRGEPEGKPPTDDHSSSRNFGTDSPACAIRPFSVPGLRDLC